MRAVLINPPESFLAERRRQGSDRWDEVWEGVLHMVPPPSGEHQLLGTKLVMALGPKVERLGLVITYETGVFRPGSGTSDYRVPDLVISRPEVRTSRGVEGAPEVVIELLSPGDESREKLPFYESLGTREVVLVDPETRSVELYVRRAEKLHVALPDDQGGVRSEILEIRFVPVEGPRLRLEGPDGATEL